MKLSFCLIVGNEMAHIERCLRSFAPFADEFCIVQAIGNQGSDGTLDKAVEICEELGVEIKTEIYLNQGTENSGHVVEAINPDFPDTWPHVDNFAAARNLSFSLASGDWLMWVDADDILPAPGEDNAEFFRRLKSGLYEDYDVIHGIYLAWGSQIYRERVIKSGRGNWEMPLHEAYVTPGAVQRAFVQEFTVLHDPKVPKGKDAIRNLRILDYFTERPELCPNDQAMLWFYKHRDTMNFGDLDSSIKYGEKAIQFKDLPHVERYECLLNMSAALIQQGKEIGKAKTKIFNALNVCSWRREAYILLAQLELQLGNYRNMLGFTHALRGIPKPKNMERPWTLRDHCYGWFGARLHSQALRLNGHEKAAKENDRSVFEAEKGRITIIHPTRLNPMVATRTQNEWIEKAANPGGVQYIFAIDDDDPHSKSELRPFARVSSPGAGNVKSVLAALPYSLGNIIGIVQDGFEPTPGWDKLILEKLDGEGYLMEGELLFGEIGAMIHLLSSGKTSLKETYEEITEVKLPIQAPKKPTRKVRKEGVRYVICGKEGKSPFPDFQPEYCHFELGWEVNTTHVMAKRMLLDGELRLTDNIVTLPGREFFYRRLFSRVITWEEYCDEKGIQFGTPVKDAGADDVLDLCWLFERNWWRFPEWFTSGPGLTYDRPDDWPYIQSIEGDLIDVQVPDKFICLASRIRNHESLRNMSQDFTKDLLENLQERFGIPIFLVGLNLPDYGVKNVFPINLRQWIALIRHPGCVVAMGPHTGTTATAGLFAPEGRKIIIFPRQPCISINGNFPTGMGKCLNLNQNERIWLPVGATPEQIVNATEMNLLLTSGVV